MEKHRVELTESYEDWVEIRECFVRSFRHYPLYKYMVPDAGIRDQFMRKYFDANYEVTVGEGKAILLAIKAPPLHDSDGEPCIIGGVVFLMPDDERWGWQASHQDDFDRAYHRHHLHHISHQGLQRLKRYEDWENALLERPVRCCELPMWNAIFCAISPEYTNMGICSMLYERAIDIMARHWLHRHHPHQTCHRPFPLPPTSSPSSAALIQARRRKSVSHVSSQHQHYRRNRRLSETLERPILAAPATSETGEAPLVLAVSHSDRSANFHKSNGFSSMRLIPYYDPVLDTTPFYVHILAHEPFRNGNLPRFDASVQESIPTVPTASPNKVPS